MYIFFIYLFIHSWYIWVFIKIHLKNFTFFKSKILSFVILRLSFLQTIQQKSFKYI